MNQFKQYLAIALTITFIAHTLPQPLRAQAIVRGADSAESAAAAGATTTAATDELLGLALAPAVTAAYAFADTSEFEFPEEDRSHLARDITIFVIVSVFVAFFIVKVFIEDEPDEPDTGGSGGGKGTP